MKENTDFFFHLQWLWFSSHAMLCRHMYPLKLLYSNAPAFLLEQAYMLGMYFSVHHAQAYFPFDALMLFTKFRYRYQNSSSSWQISDSKNLEGATPFIGIDNFECLNIQLISCNITSQKYYEHRCYLVICYYSIILTWYWPWWHDTNHDDTMLPWLVKHIFYRNTKQKRLPQMHSNHCN